MVREHTNTAAQRQRAPTQAVSNSAFTEHFLFQEQETTLEQMQTQLGKVRPKPPALDKA